MDEKRVELTGKRWIDAVLEKAADSYRIIASTDQIDRDQEIILSTAFKNLSAYLSMNPVILWAHQYGTFPIAKATSGKISDHQLQLTIVFADTSAAQEAKQLFDGGFLNMFSVGFIPINWDVNGEGVRVYTEVELLEVSAVPVPSNRAASLIRQAEAKGIACTEMRKMLHLEPSSIEKSEASPVRKVEGRPAERKFSEKDKIKLFGRIVGNGKD